MINNEKNSAVTVEGKLWKIGGAVQICEEGSKNGLKGFIVAVATGDDRDDESSPAEIIGSYVISEGKTIILSRPSSSVETYEIERKFLISQFPDLPLLDVYDVYQAYLSVQPEIRIRLELKDRPEAYLGIKSNGFDVRAEHEVPIDKCSFWALETSIFYNQNKHFIKKQHKIYQLPNSERVLECNLVDDDKIGSFMYAEVEFDLYEDAQNFVPPAFLGKEVTFDPKYKMKNYWQNKKD